MIAVLRELIRSSHKICFGSEQRSGSVLCSVVATPRQPSLRSYFFVGDIRREGEDSNAPLLSRAPCPSSISS